MSPYIKQDNRGKFQGIFDILREIDVTTPGELNYLLTGIMMIYQDSVGESYTSHNEIMGVLTCVQQEWYRRQTIPYEEKKREENGDVKVW